MDKVTQVFYDRESDVLYLSVGEPRRAISREVGDDVVIRIDPKTDDIIGLTIMNLASRFGEIDSPQSLPVAIDLHELAN
jgi:uncharacterized protein YuzE